MGKKVFLLEDSLSIHFKVNGKVKIIPLNMKKHIVFYPSLYKGEIKITEDFYLIGISLGTLKIPKNIDIPSFSIDKIIIVDSADFYSKNLLS